MNKEIRTKTTGSQCPVLFCIKELTEALGRGRKLADGWQCPFSADRCVPSRSSATAPRRFSAQTEEMKGNNVRSQSGEMDEKRVCKNCKRDVAAANFSLHEAHCMRFLAICPRCEELVASKAMKEHLANAHQQVRCQLCHQMMQQYLLERHEAEECQWRSVKCHFCDLELPFHKLPAHLDACGSRTTKCWDCGKYVMRKVQEGHRLMCQGSNMLRAPAPISAPVSAPSSPPWKLKAEDVHPKDRDVPSVEKVSMKPPKSKKKKCQCTAALQALRRSPRFLGKGEESMPGSPGESSLQ